MKLLILAILFFSNSVFAYNTMTTQAVCSADHLNLEIAVETNITTNQSYISMGFLDTIRPPIVVEATITNLRINKGFVAYTSNQDDLQITVKVIDTETPQTTEKLVQWSKLTIPALEVSEEAIFCNLDIPSKF